MSLYNVLFGVNQVADVLLGCLGITSANIPRFRDCFMADGKIVIHTRTGGGNRDYYGSETQCRANYPEYFDGKDDPAGPWNEDLQKLPGYLYDEDDDFDCTYANFYFSIPDEYADELLSLSEGSLTVTPGEKWTALMNALREQS